MLNFSNITSFFKRNKKILYYTGFFVILFMIGSGDVFAADPTAAELETKKVQGWMTILNSIVAGLAGLLALMTYLVTMFLDPAWLNGSLFKMTGVFKEIWILVSNVVYFIFAFILIWISFMNIIGKGDKWELKSALPKFIIGVLIVPFSWFFIQFILSISAIFTASVITLPADTFKEEYKTILDKGIIPKECNINFGGSASAVSVDATTSNTNGVLKASANPIGGSASTSNSFVPSYLQSPSATSNVKIPYKPSSGSSKKQNKGIINCKGSDKMSLKEAFTSDNIQGAIFGSIAVYTYGVVNIEKLGQLSNKDVVSGIKTISDFIFKVVFDVLFVLIFAILMITLGLVLIVRGIYIWIYTMMSPIFGLMYFFDKKEGGGDGFFGKFNLKEFIALSMVPVYVMAALSFGFLFIHVVGKGMYVGSSNSSFNLSDDGKSITIGKVKLNISGSINASSIEKATLLGDKASKVAGGIMGLIGGIIMQLFAIIVLRGAVMAALRSSEITKTLTQPIYDFGNQVGGLVAKSPMYAPVFGGQSMQSLQTFSSDVSGKIRQRVSEPGTKLSDQIFGKGGVSSDLLKLKNGYSSSDTTKRNTQLKELLDAIPKGGFKNDGNWKEWKELFKDRTGSEIDSSINRNSTSTDMSTAIAKAINSSTTNTNIIRNSPDFLQTSIKKNIDTETKLPGTAPISPTGNDLDVVRDVSNKVVRMEVGNMKILFDNTGKNIRTSSLDEFIKYLDGKTEDNVKDVLNNQGFNTSEIGTLIKQALSGNLEEVPDSAGKITYKKK